jgi:hypothetical protein
VISWVWVVGEVKRDNGGCQRGGDAEAGEIDTQGQEIAMNPWIESWTTDATDGHGS